MNGYLMLHLLGAILFVGNIVTAAFWKTTADRTANPAVILQAARNVMRADWVFTVPGLALLIVSGSLMAANAGYSLSGLNWLTLSLALFAVTAIIWLAALIPLQRKMIRQGEEAVRLGVPTAAYRRSSLNWAIFGTLATLLPLIILYLMIAKSNIG
ncbi:DUF2269 family protein [Cohnella zeiphila]|uniref:DUF2269 domain-containing protein n=1 Tax=Cohnella zeiphila TaxID=2761120 RepID=A0A7X0SG01_9BACL|nr:DUF2269 domain-containing protein [Cohnella zeiphila]MBB6729286.1 DUF2269 domain-containing protein [Cohnella zeiphila]